jgi:hypothetical protein
MLKKSVSSVAPWIISACAAVSLASFGIYIKWRQSSQFYCSRSDCTSSACMATEDINLWGMIQKQNWELAGMYLALVFVGIYAIALIVERSLVFQDANRDSREFQAKACQAL